MSLSSKKTKLLRTSCCVSYELPTAILDSYSKKKKKLCLFSTMLYFFFFHYALNNHLICKSDLWDNKHHSYLLRMSMDRAENLQSPRKYRLLDIKDSINKLSTSETHCLLLQDNLYKGGFQRVSPER